MKYLTNFVLLQEYSKHLVLNCCLWAEKHKYVCIYRDICIKIYCRTGFDDRLALRIRRVCQNASNGKKRRRRRRLQLCEKCFTFCLTLATAIRSLASAHQQIHIHIHIYIYIHAVKANSTQFTYWGSSCVWNAFDSESHTTPATICCCCFLSVFKLCLSSA